MPEIINNMGVYQHSENNLTVYNVLVAPGCRIASIATPNNGQYLSDAKMLQLITKALAQRWGVSSGKSHRN